MRLPERSIVPARANPDTRILSYKSADTAEAHPAFIKLAGFLGTPHRSRPVDADPVEREEKRQRRELRRECDRLLLEAALGWDTELIERIRP